jgi:hypothetical protein
MGPLYGLGEAKDDFIASLSARQKRLLDVAIKYQEQLEAANAAFVSTAGVLPSKSKAPLGIKKLF